jgi:hypothetical protein
VAAARWRAGGAEGGGGARRAGGGTVAVQGRVGGGAVAVQWRWRGGEEVAEGGESEDGSGGARATDI